MPDPRNKRRSSNNNAQRGHPRGWQTAYPLPRDTARFVDRHSGHAANQNLGLWLDRFVTWTDEDDRGRDKELKPADSANQRNAPMLKPKQDVLEWGGHKQLVWGLRQRWEKMFLSYHYREYFFSKPDWRFVVGLGGASVLETGMTLHRLYGLPLIPGSALKGVARAWAETGAGLNESDRDVITAVFGKSSGDKQLTAGEIIFFDAIPNSIPRFKLDIMNPHYPKYYQGDEPPTDWQNPNPILFLTVTQTEFLFTIAARTKAGETHLKTALDWLKQGVTELGVGAKTAAGYGYFQEVK